MAISSSPNCADPALRRRRSFGVLTYATKDSEVKQNPSQKDQRANGSGTLYTDLSSRVFHHIEQYINTIMKYTTIVQSISCWNIAFQQSNPP